MWIQAGGKDAFSHGEGAETLVQVAQSGGGCPISGNIQRQVGQASKQPALVGEVPVPCRRIGLGEL